MLDVLDKVYDEKTAHIHQFFEGAYWDNDVWNIDCDFFKETGIKTSDWNSEYKNIDFSGFNEFVKQEIKYMFASKLELKIIKLRTLITYGSSIKNLASFLNTRYPHIHSILDIPYEKIHAEWTACISHFCKEYVQTMTSLYNRLYDFIYDYYDEQSEYSKDKWNVQKLSGIKIGPCQTAHLNFSDFPEVFKPLMKRYIRARLNVVSYTTTKVELWSLKIFLKFIHEIEPLWTDLIMLSRKHMKDYFTWCRDNTRISTMREPKRFTQVRKFLEYIQLADYEGAPAISVSRLIFREDYKVFVCVDEDKIKFIPETVIAQLEGNLEYLHPTKYIPVVILLRATGWRISDIMNLKYDKCLERTKSGWYLCGDIPKTGILNHRVPITDEVACVVQTVIDGTKRLSTADNNPYKLLFVVFYGARRGLCHSGCTIRRVLNKLAAERNIVDDNGQLFHFKNHAFRHTKGVELINNGMSLLHVQKWMAHLSPEMTLVYAKILDTTMRKSWEEATKRGLFRIDERGSISKIDISQLENEDMVEWEYIRHHLDAVRMPLGFCMKPKKVDCKAQLNPCLTCRNLCTTPDFIPQYEIEMQEVAKLIDIGKSQGRDVWVEKNTMLLSRYEEILAVLKSGKTRHGAGKSGRELIGEERGHES